MGNLGGYSLGGYSLGGDRSALPILGQVGHSPAGRLVWEATVWEASVWEAAVWEATIWEATVSHATVFGSGQPLTRSRRDI